MKVTLHSINFDTATAVYSIQQNDGTPVFDAAVAQIDPAANLATIRQSVKVQAQAKVAADKIEAQAKVYLLNTVDV